ncbi:MAG: WcaF family extracellular polysaccharide biosynthesis acetyltransferase [Breznakibacter sp.]
MPTNLSIYDNSWYDTGAGVLKRTLWYMVNVLVMANPLNPVSGLKVAVLKWFGARIGTGVVIKPGVNVKYPWRLEVGNHTWIGERVWIDNLDHVKIGNHCCLSQGALLLCGNHDYKKSTFDLLISPIILEDGVWIGAMSVVTGGVTCGTHLVLAAGSLASKSMEPYTIYRGNPGIAVKVREMEG